MALRRYLIILAALTILPLVGFTTWIVLEVHREDRARAERALTETARALSLAVERDVAAMVAALEALATSKDLDAAGLRSFYAQAAALRAMREQDWTTIALLDPSGAALFDLQHPFGPPPPALPVDADDLGEVIRARRPIIGDSTRGAAPNTRGLAVLVPVVRNGRVTYVLYGIAPTAGLRDVL